MKWSDYRVCELYSSTVQSSGLRAHVVRTDVCKGLKLATVCCSKNLEEISSSVITKWKCNFPSCPLRKQLKNKCGTQRWRRKTETFPGVVEKSVGTKPKRISTSEPEQKVLALKRKQRFFPDIQSRKIIMKIFALFVNGKEMVHAVG